MGVSGELADSLNHRKWGIDGGIGLRWPRSARSWGVQGELLYTIRHRSFDDEDVGHRSITMTYIQATLLSRHLLRSAGKHRPYVVAGPYVGWRRSSDFAPGGIVGDEPVNPADVRATEPGVILGLGSDLISGAGRASFEARFSRGFVNVLDDSAGIDGVAYTFALLVAFTPSR